MHDYHDELKGYDPRQIWHDGCAECEERGKSLPYTLGNLDNESFVRAWERATAWNLDHDTVGHISDAERVLLETLWAMQVAFQRLCGLPLGALPLTDEQRDADSERWFESHYRAR